MGRDSARLTAPGSAAGPPGVARRGVRPGRPGWLPPLARRLSPTGHGVVLSRAPHRTRSCTIGRARRHPTAAMASATSVLSESTSVRRRSRTPTIAARWRRSVGLDCVVVVSGMVDLSSIPVWSSGVTGARLSPSLPASAATVARCQGGWHVHRSAPLRCYRRRRVARSVGRRRWRAAGRACWPSDATVVVPAGKSGSIPPCLRRLATMASVRSRSLRRSGVVAGSWIRSSQIVSMSVKSPALRHRRASG